ncbi:unnamed protein product [Acanthoscelides obtectus]|nr:unnamed protein product [Acanthoscelides obtectus]CAK1640450.1 Leucine-rich PPR motif-containing protein, mitochondrial [Acanthoscelides obtectus]
MILLLMRNKKLKEAVTLSNTFKVALLEETLIDILPKTWKNTRDAQNTILILQKCCESSKKGTELVAEFLIKCLELCYTINDYRSYLDLLKIVGSNRLRISPAAAEMLQEILSHCNDNDLLLKIRESINDLMDINLKSDQHTPYIPHPRDMNLEELECHLVELKEKGLETRGVISKLIQRHSNNGNTERVKELQQEFEASGYKKSLGTKSVLMHNYVKTRNLDKSMQILQQIKESDTQFRIDDFKVIDLATLLVQNGKFDEALNILRTEIKKPSRKATDRNILELLQSLTDPNQQMQIFECIMDVGYVPNNVILGPLVRIHLTKGDIKSAAKTYISLAEKYKCTPLQFELIKELVRNKDEELLQQILSCTQRIHGLASTQANLIAALVEENEKKALEKVLINNKLNLNERLRNRCDRWVKEKKIYALTLLASYCEKFPEINDVSSVYKCIMRIHVTNNDCQSALNFYNCLLNEEKHICSELENMLTELFRQNHYKVPDSMRIKNS